MSMTYSDPPGTMRIGWIMSESLQVFRRNWLLFTGLTIVFAAVPNVMIHLRLMDLMAVLSQGAESFDPQFFKSEIYNLSIIWAILMVVGWFLHITLVSAAVEDINGLKATLGSSTSVTLSLLMPAFGLWLLIVLGVWVGMILLVIPGIYLALRWSVAIPIFIQERRGILDSLAGSAALTKGNMWRILALVLICYGLTIIMALVLNIFSLIALAIGLDELMLSVTIQAVLVTVLTIMMAIVSVITYVELRRAKGSLNPAAIEDVFA